MFLLVPAHPGGLGQRAVKRLLQLHLVCVCVGSAINADSGEANKVCNVVTGEVGAVPAVARFYKVINIKNYSLSIMLTATDQKMQRSLKMVFLTITLPSVL